MAKRFMPRWAFWTVLTLFLVTFQLNNILGIVLSAQTVDITILDIFGKTCAIQFSPNVTAYCVYDSVGENSPFGEAWVISLGFVVLTIMVIPLGFFNLDDNIKIQVASTIILLVIMVEWAVQFAYIGAGGGNSTGWVSMPAVGPDSTRLISTILFNYAYVATIPSWVNEMGPGVNINKSLWVSGVAGSLAVWFLGFFGGLAYYYSDYQTLTTVMNGSASSWQATKVMIALFPWVSLVSGIPVNSIIIRYNLMECGLCGKKWANFWAGVFPWIVSLILYKGNLVTSFISYASLFVTIPLNFVVPCALHYICCRRQQRGPSFLHHHHKAPLPVKSIQSPARSPPAELHGMAADHYTTLGDSDLTAGFYELNAEATANPPYYTLPRFIRHRLHSKALPYIIIGVSVSLNIIAIALTFAG